MTLYRENLETQLEIKLDQPERWKRAMEAADLTSQLESLEEEKKKVMAEFKEQMDSLEEEIRSLLKTAKSGKEWTKVAAETVMDPQNGMIWVEYQGVRYHERQMTKAEYDKGMEPMFINVTPIRDSK